MSHRNFLSLLRISLDFLYVFQLKSEELAPLARETERLKRDHANLAERVKMENLEQSKNLAAFESGIQSIHGIILKIKEYVYLPV